uniref:Ig-like domain-containing protein n=1 Tax=Poecilia reticulata TaxID=8081 RepID=A0A3P9NG59_POERE
MAVKIPITSHIFIKLPCCFCMNKNLCFDFSGTEKISCKEDEDVILPCSFKETLTTKRFDWKKDGKDVLLYDNGKVHILSPDEQFSHRVSHFPDQLNSGNASISIKKAQVSDRGNYTCLNIDSAKSYTIELTVGEFFYVFMENLKTLKQHNITPSKSNFCEIKL